MSYPRTGAGNTHESGASRGVRKKDGTQKTKWNPYSVGGVSKGRRNQLKLLPVAKAGTVWAAKYMEWCWIITQNVEQTSVNSISVHTGKISGEKANLLSRRVVSNLCRHASLKEVEHNAGPEVWAAHGHFLPKSTGEERGKGRVSSVKKLNGDYLTRWSEVNFNSDRSCWECTTDGISPLWSSPQTPNSSLSRGKHHTHPHWRTPPSSPQTCPTHWKQGTFERLSWVVVKRA